MPSQELNQAIFSSPAEFASNFLNADKPGRKELLKKLIELNPKKISLLIKSRKIARYLKEKNAPFYILLEYETTLARTLRPKRKGHIGAQFFSERHYERKIKPYLEEIDELQKKGRYTSTALMPIIARMTNVDGRELALEYFSQAHGKLKEICIPLEVIESALASMKNGIIRRPMNKQEYKKKWEVVKKFFDTVYKKDLGPIFIRRAELDDMVKIYGKALWKYYEFLENRSKKIEKPKPPGQASTIIPAGINDRPLKNISDETYDDLTENNILQPSAGEVPVKRHNRKELKTVVISSVKNSPEFKQSQSTAIKTGDMLIPKIGDVYKSLLDIHLRNAWIDLVKAEKVVTDEEKEKIDLKIQDILDVEAIMPPDDESEEIKKQKEEYISRLIQDLESRENVSARMGVINNFRSSSGDTIIDDVHTVYEILLKREKNKHAKTQNIVKQAPGRIQKTGTMTDKGRTDLDSLQSPGQETLLPRHDNTGVIEEYDHETGVFDTGGYGEESEENGGPGIPGTPAEPLVHAEPLVQLEEDPGGSKALELKYINEIIANILTSQDDDSYYQELGRAVSGGKFLSPEELVNEISKQAGTIEDEHAKKKFHDILAVSNKILREVEPLPSSVRKITKLDFWISDEHADKPHANAFLEGQKIELKLANQDKGHLLGDIFKALSRIQDAWEKIKYLNDKLNDPAYRHLRSTISTIIENLEKEIDLEPSNISSEWIDSELSNTGDLDASLDWLSIRKCLLSFQDYTDHLNLKTAEIEEKLEEDTFTECVKTSLEKKEVEGKKPVVYKNIISLTRAALDMEKPGKRQKLIKEQEILAPHNDGSNNFFKKQRKLLFYLMGTSSDEGNKRLKALADRVSMPFKEKQEYLKILKLSKYKDKEGTPVTWKGELGITDEDISYYAGYILGTNKPFKKRIAYLEKVRDENVNETYIKYKENYGITPKILNKIIGDLKNKTSANRERSASGSAGTEKEPSREKNAETHRGKKRIEDIAASGDLAKNIGSISEEPNKVEKSAGIPGTAGVKTDKSAGSPPTNVSQETEEEITESKTGIPDAVTKALTGASDFIKPHSVIVKAANDETYSGKHNRDKRQSIINQLYNEEKIFTYDGGSTYIGWGKIAGFVSSQAYKEKSPRKKRMFSERLNRYLKRFKNKEDKYGFLGIQTDNKIKMENNFKLLLKRIGSHDNKNPLAVSITGKKQKMSAPVKTRKRTKQASTKPKKTTPQKKDKQKKDRKPKTRKTPSPKTAKQKDSRVKNPVQKEKKPKATEPEDPTAVVLEALDKNMKAILMTANGRITKKLTQILENANDPSELSKLFKIYLKPGNQENLLKLLEVFFLVNESLFSAIKESSLLTKGLGFDRKKIMKFYEKKKKNFAKTKSKSNAA